MKARYRISFKNSDSPSPADIHEVRIQNALGETKGVLQDILFKITPLYLLFWICDIVYSPSNMWLFLAYRITVIPFAILAYWVSKRSTNLVKAQMPAILYALVASLCITLMIFQTQGPTSLYTTGLNLICIAAISFIPWVHNSLMAITLVCIYGPLSIATIWFINPSNAKQTVVTFFFIGATIVIAFVIRRFNESLRLREIKAALILKLELLNREAIIREKTSSLRELNLTLQENNEHLKSLDKLKDDFLANTSHELKTPLNGIINLADSLIDGVAGAVEPAMMEDLQHIIAGGKRLEGLVNDLLDFSKLKNKDISLQYKKVDLKTLVDAVVKILVHVNKKREVALKNLVPAGFPMISIDENRVQQVLYNIIGNAIKFTEVGTINIEATSYEDTVEIKIQDTGIGIPEDKLESIFKSFEQADSSIERHYGGTGLGLPISKQLIELHGGEISVTSKLNQGSCFIISLPKTHEHIKDSAKKVELIKTSDTNSPSKQPQNLEQNLEQDLERRKQSSWDRRVHNIPYNGTDRREGLRDRRDLVPMDQLKNIQILVADDEQINLKVLKNLLKLHGAEGQFVEDGQAAIDLIKSGYLPDILILDIMMPKKNGFDVCLELRKTYSPSELPIIMLTAKSQMSDLMQGFQKGANDYITKPFYKSELFSRIKIHHRLSKTQKATARFVPNDLLKMLEKDHITELMLGDNTAKEMTVLFSDIRSFTTMSENMSAQDTFQFINVYFSQMGPIIRKYGGFIDKYIGDAVMALFEGPDDAIHAGIEMQYALLDYNRARKERNRSAIKIGIGIHTGPLMLGTIGEEKRMEGTVIGDTVNTASRLESATKQLGLKIIASAATYNKLSEPANFNMEPIPDIEVKGKNVMIPVYKVVV
ncbi:MAG: response regulator [Bacteriovoracaceae bacterium]|nr:response regulator [Bacteriovoracaceae bacterium]